MEVPQAALARKEVTINVESAFKNQTINNEYLEYFLKLIAGASGFTVDPSISVEEMQKTIGS